MSKSTLKLKVAAADIESAKGYAKLSTNYTQKKLEQQQSKFSGTRRLENIEVGRIARDVVIRFLNDRGIFASHEDSSHTESTHFCIVAADGLFIQTRFIGNKPNYKYLLEDTRSFEQRHHDFYIAVTSRDNLKTIEILGYATREEMTKWAPKEFGQGVLNRYVPLSNLHPIEELWEILRSSAVRSLRKSFNKI